MFGKSSNDFEKKCVEKLAITTKCIICDIKETDVLRIP